MSGWQYRKDGVFQSDTVGPVTDAEMLQLCFAGKVSGETLVIHPVRTKGQWAKLSSFPAATQKIEEGKRSRAAMKEAQRQAIEATKAEQLRVAAEQRASAPWARFVLDGQNEAVVQKVMERVQQFLTPDEQIQYIAVQAKPVAIAPDSVVLTNSRLMIFRPRMLGQMDFQDFWWLHLGNAHVKEGVMFSTFSASCADGRFLSLDYLPKAQAAAIYRIAQQRELQAWEQRRQMDLERQRAGAANYSVNVAALSPQQPAATLEAPDDPIARLGKAKAMLDAGLISQEDFDATKAKILGSL